MIAPAEYADFVGREYLDEFVRLGGSAVKFVVPGHAGWAEELERELRGQAERRDYAFARVDAAHTKVHMIDKVFADVAAQVDWDERAEVVVRGVLGQLGFPADEGDLDLARLAAVKDYDQAELLRDVKARLQSELRRESGLAPEFRTAMLRLAVARIDRSDLADAERQVILQWLRGELRLIGALKQAGIYQRIARHNARDMLLSLTRWLARSGRNGLVLTVDIRRCALAKRPADDDDGIFYTKAAVLDVYEVLRQLIDATDELEHCFVCIVAQPETLVDPRRGIEHHYQALKMRIWNEVHDRMRENPLSALVRLGDEAEGGQ
jgi:hypothetical protein